MVLQDFYTINDVSVTDNRLNAVVKIYAAHHIFDGHFPSQPVTPGVVQIQMVREILEQHFSEELSLDKIGRCKFLNVWDPNVDPSIGIEIMISEKESDEIKINAVGKTEEKTFFKFNAVFK